MTVFRSLEAEDRRAELRRVGAEYGLQVFIETGTNQGLTTLALKDAFRELYTIELDQELFAAAQMMLAAYPQIQCRFGDSSVVLPRVLAQIDEPALVWLDGHYSGPGTAHGAESSPIREELRILFDDGRPHVILVDDARIFEGGPEHALYPHYAPYPSIEWVVAYAAEHGYAATLRDDIIRLVPRATR